MKLENKMTKSIGILLFISSIAALFAGAFIEMNYGATAEVTGRVVASSNTGNFGYLEAAVFSYSIISLIMGVVFLLRV